MDLLDLPTALTVPHENPLLADTADRFPGPPPTETDRLARLMIAAWEKAEGPVTPSYVATFADMAKVVVADIELRTEVLRTVIYGLDDDDDD